MRILRLIKKFNRVRNNYGLRTAAARVIHFLGNVEGRRNRKLDVEKTMHMQGDVLFINGCSVEHPTRYRVLHQLEQLEAAGLIGSKVYFEDIHLNMENNFKMFIFYRCECTKEVELFIEKAKLHGKAVCFDVDDLVTDIKYTNEVAFVKELTSTDKDLFDESVTLTGKTLKKCNLAITTTEELAHELEKESPRVFINRNTASKEMINCAELAFKNQRSKKKNSEMIWIGYFSGSLTHNNDFSLVHQALIRLMAKNKNIGLLLAGELDSKDKLLLYAERIVKKETVGWRELPALIAEADINIAPLEDTLFNRCKSEIKWIEAALVRVPTIASRVGAFETMIEDGVTGLLCDNTTEEWFDKLDEMICDQTKRNRIGENAYTYVMNNCTTVAKAAELEKFVVGVINKGENNDGF